MATQNYAAINCSIIIEQTVKATRRVFDLDSTPYRSNDVRNFSIASKLVENELERICLFKKSKIGQPLCNSQYK